MPTNDERREIAAKLRELRVPLRFSPTCSLSEIIHGRDGCASYDSCDKCEADVLRALADLIEPEERTCCNVGGEEWGFKCSECGGHTHGSPFHVPDEEREELAEMLGGRIMSLHGSVPRFCPACGARVVDDHA